MHRRSVLRVAGEAEIVYDPGRGDAWDGCDGRFVGGLDGEAEEQAAKYTALPSSTTGGNRRHNVAIAGD